MAGIERSKIELYVQRTFGEKITVIFDFISENIKTVLKMIAYFMLPFSLIMALSINLSIDYFFSMFSNLSDNQNLFQMAVAYLYTIILGMTAYAFLISLVYGMMKIYFTRPEGLNGIDVQMLWAEMKCSLKRSFIIIGVAVAVFFIILLVSMPLFAMSPVFVLFTYLLLLLVFVPLAMFAPTYLFERLPLYKAFTKSMRLGFKTWMGVFTVAIVIGIIIYILVAITSIPWSICYFIKMFLAVDTTALETLSFSNSIAFDILMFVFGVINAFGSFLGTSVILLAMGIQYGHAAEKLYGMSVAMNVERFESLSDSADANSGEFISGDRQIDNFEHI